ncbi:terminase TerL endonuclease subunit [Azospirillum sp.]|uniref:terminase TerL endonuclease subunit n=1 Tax=Azospirillum sp. TaxID=34012 RepID=UPI00262CB716|nr:terminase TerL endonuclease subunit [Azospirillum sp.]
MAQHRFPGNRGRNRIDSETVVAHVVGLTERFDLQEVAIDRWNSTAVTTALQREDITVATFRQGFASMAAPVCELKRVILDGEFRHGGNPVLRMCFAKLVAEKDATENEKFTKEKARGRIDSAVAAAMAVGRILADDDGPSVTRPPTGRTASLSSAEMVKEMPMSRRISYWCSSSSYRRAQVGLISPPYLQCCTIAPRPNSRGCHREQT